MIVLKVIGWILFILLAIIFVILILPIRGQVSFIEKKLSYSARLWIIPVLDSQGGGILGWLKKRRSKKDSSDDDDEPADDWYKEDDDLSSAPEPISEGELDDLDSILSEGAVREETDETEETQSPAPSPAEPEPSSPASPAETAEAEELPGENAPSTDTESSTQEEVSEDEEKKTLGDKVEMILDLWRAADRPVLKIFKGIHLSELYIDFLIAHEDAYKCALNYGKVSGVMYNLLGWLSVLFTVKLKTVDILPGFAQKESRYDAACKVTFRLGTVVIAGIAFLITYIFKYFIPNKLQSRKAKVR